MCVFFPYRGDTVDIRVPSLGGNAAHNALHKYGLDFRQLNRLNEHGLIISDYNSWHDCYQMSVVRAGADDRTRCGIPFRFQRRNWIIVPLLGRRKDNKLRLHGVSLNASGGELSRVVHLEEAGQFIDDLRAFFRREKLEMKAMNV